MKKILSIILSAIMLCCILIPAVSAAEVDVSKPESAHVSFGDDGKLTILQIADMQDNAVLSSYVKLLIKAAIEKTAPDLIVLTGDNIAGYSCATKGEAKLAIRQFMTIFEKYGIPVVQVFGNHDDQDTALTKEGQVEYYETYKCFIGCKGVIAEKTVDGKTMKNVGTYNVPIYESANSDNVLFNIWCFDSGNYNPDKTYGGYGYVLDEQIEWYVQKSNELKTANGGEAVPSIAFQHIVPPQIKYALKEVENGTEGAIGFDGKSFILPDYCNPASNWLSEAPCPPNPDFAEGYKQVDAMLSQGDVLGVFFGHDHINSYDVEYKGIHLVSSPGCTTASYNDSNRGFRAITIDKTDLTTYTSEVYNARDLSEDKPLLSSFVTLYAVWDVIVNFFENLWDNITGLF
ncbi:MAG: metallophosphoesterase [Oscillospiraceae bacterium]|nr:metallophosphoesterase [Oscillospiraceae bacterium]